MNKLVMKSWMVLNVTAGLLLTQSSASAKPWISAYYSHDEENLLRHDEIQYDKLSHIIAFAIEPISTSPYYKDASQWKAKEDKDRNGISDQDDLVRLAHQNGVKVILTILAGWDTTNTNNMRYVTADDTICATYVANIMSYVRAHKYDGVDVDWEFPDVSGDKEKFARLLRFLGAEKAKYQWGENGDQQGLIAIATGSSPAVRSDLLYPVPEIIQYVDQVNVMTYDMGGAYNAAIYKSTLPGVSAGSTCDARLKSWVTSGMPKGRVGIGVPFYGYKGACSGPTGGCGLSTYMNLPAILTFKATATYNWDDSAKQPWLSTSSAYISYDDEAAVKAKADYVVAGGWGGAMIWTIGEGTVRQSGVAKQPLLEALASAMWGGTPPPPPPVDTTSPTLTISSPANGSTVTSAILAISGTASDNVGVTSVQVQVNSGSFVNATGTAAWSANVTLVNGSNTINVKAFDAAGNVSSIASRSVTYSVTPPPADTIAPTLTITAPLNGSTVTSATLSVSGTSSDAVGVTQVQVQLNGGSFVNATGTTAWSSSVTLAVGANTIGVQAKDAAGNTTSGSVSVTYSTTPPPPSSDLWIYREGLENAWSNASWNLTAVYNSTDRAFAGANSIKATSTAKWGGLEVRHSALSTAAYTNVSFAVYPTVANFKLGVAFVGTAGAELGKKDITVAAANQWTVVTVPVTDINPAKAPITNLFIQDESGTFGSAYYIDELKLGGSTTPPPPPPPADTVAPYVVIFTPVQAETCNTATVNISGSAEDNVGATLVQVRLNGGTWNNATGTLSWNHTGTLVNGNNRIEVQAKDGAGNTSAIQSVDVTHAPAGTTADNWVYNDALVSPWIQASWNSMVNLSSTEKIFNGIRATKVDITKSWGAVGYHSGAWGKETDVTLNQYKGVAFAVYPTTTGLKLNIRLNNKSGGNFPGRQVQNLPVGQWTVVRVAMADLNAFSQSLAHGFYIQDLTGQATNTFFVDDVNFYTTDAATTASTLASSDVPVPEFDTTCGTSCDTSGEITGGCATHPGAGNGMGIVLAGMMLGLVALRAQRKTL